MKHTQWMMTLLLISVSSMAFAIEGGGSRDRDVSRGDMTSGYDSDDYYQGYQYHQTKEMRARHQRARDDDAERYYGKERYYDRDFDVQGKMNN